MRGLNRTVPTVSAELLRLSSSVLEFFILILCQSEPRPLPKGRSPKKGQSEDFSCTVQMTGEADEVTTEPGRPAAREVRGKEEDEKSMGSWHPECTKRHFLG